MQHQLTLTPLATQTHTQRAHFTVVPLTLSFITRPETIPAGSQPASTFVVLLSARVPFPPTLQPNVHVNAAAVWTEEIHVDLIDATALVCLYYVNSVLMLTFQLYWDLDGLL